MSRTEENIAADVTRIIQDHGYELVFSDLPEGENTFKGLYANSSHQFYRDFYAEAGQIEKRPELIVLEGAAWPSVTEDMNFTLMGLGYKTDAPPWPEIPAGVCLYVVYPIYRFSGGTEP